MTVNHGVVGSSPTGGAKKKSIAYAVLFFLLSPLCLLPTPHLRACADYGRGRLRPGSERSERCR